MGCEASDSLRITVADARSVFIPNVFSPNSDGQNDYFTVFGSALSIEAVERLAVYDRWGELVFEQNNLLPNNPSVGWDGTFRGKTLVPGVYVYVAQIRFLDGQMVEYAGDITLIR